MQRYFSLSKEQIEISINDIHHILHVMRGRIGDFFEVVFNEKIYTMEITSLNPFEYQIRDINSFNNELTNKITLIYALSKGDKNEFVIQKATELGVSKIVLVSSRRSVVKMSQDDFDKKKIRYQKIIKEASEQSKRNVLPEIVGLYSLDKLPKEVMSNINLVAYEEDSGSTKGTFAILDNVKNDESISIVIGSEGGIDKEELNYLNNNGFKNISLGKRILRTESAAVYALSVISFMLERK